MSTNVNLEKPKIISSFNGIDIYLIETDKFKTNTINIFFHDILNRENVTKNALLPAVLRRGCRDFRTMREIALYLEELYGACFDCGVMKKGETQIVQFYMEFLQERYTANKANPFEKAFDLIFKIIFDPVLNNGMLESSYIDQEKVNLKNLIDSRANDKVQYAMDRCSELMCEGEAFNIYEFGFTEDISSIDSQVLSEHYNYFIEKLPISVYITGKYENSQIDYVIEKFKSRRRKENRYERTKNIKKDIAEVRNVTEEMDVSQGKLTLGFRTNIFAGDKEYYPLLVYNGILGGGVHSKLFKNVREKSGLAYYASSSLDKYMGIMTIASGIDQDNKAKAVEIMLKQIEDIKSNNFSDYEFDSTLKVYETGLKSLRDSQYNLVDFYLGQMVSGTNDTMDDLIKKIFEVNKKQITQIAEVIKLDLIYFLKGHENKTQAGGK